MEEIKNEKEEIKNIIKKKKKFFYNLEYNKMNLNELKQNYKDLNLSLKEIRKFKKDFNVIGRWSKPKYISFLQQYNRLIENQQRVNEEEQALKRLEEAKKKLNRKINQIINKGVFKDLEKIINLVVDKKIKLNEEQIEKIIKILYTQEQGKKKIMSFQFYYETIEPLRRDEVITINTLGEEKYYRKDTYKENVKKEKVTKEEQTIYITVNTKHYIIEILKNGLLLETENPNDSDDLTDLRLIPIFSIKLDYLKTKNKLLKNGEFNKNELNKASAFFPFINTSKLDLSKYQIYNQEEIKDFINNKQKIENCLIWTLQQYDINKAILNEVKLSIEKGSYIKKIDLIKICPIIKKNIRLHTYNKNEKKIKIQKIIDNKEYEFIDIGAIHGHYFKLENTIYSSCFIKNYELLKDIENPFNITEIININKGYYKHGKQKINILNLIINMTEYFKEGDFSYIDECNDNTHTKDKFFLDNIENEQRKIKEFEDKKPFEGDIFYADCESEVTNGKHKLLLLGVVKGGENDEVKIFNKVDDEFMIIKFLDYITGNGTKKAITYFHNLKYDLALLQPYLYIIGKCVKEGQVFSVDVMYKSQKISFRDSFKYLSFGLCKFNKTLGLPKEFNKKEAIAYEYYTYENNDLRIHKDEYLKFLKQKDKITFYKEVKPFLDEKDFFNPTEYYKYYLKYDCLTLKYGFEKFSKTLYENIGLHTKDYLTISSISDAYFRKNGAYDGVYENKGNLREFISRAIYGGRVNYNEKYLNKKVKGKIADYDGVSLYPSAISRMCREKGLPKGPAKKIINLNEWEKYDYSIIEVKILEVNKKQQIPFIAYKTENGNLEYLNEPPFSYEKDEKGKLKIDKNGNKIKIIENVIIDSITLQDYILFHDIKYEIIQGVYWDSGYNQKMGELIQHLFNERLKVKEINPVLGDVYKLMLNSAYGKTIMKKSKDKIIIKSEIYFDDYVYNNFNTIKSSQKINDYCYEIKSIEFDNSYNRNHIGCMILSYSKRIMNEIFNICNDNGYIVYYTDTDSIHLDFKDLKSLESKYKEKYGKNLNGKNLEQFHPDFSVVDKNGDKIKTEEDIYSTEFLCIGKKSYIDKLEYKIKGDDKIYNDYHIRLKSITEDGLNNEVKNYNKDYMKMYENIADGNTIKFLLNPKEGKKVLFDFKNGSVSTRNTFYREVKRQEPKKDLNI